MTIHQKLTGISLALVLVVGVTTVAVTAKDNFLHVNADLSYVNCSDGYKTNFDWNISAQEITTATNALSPNETYESNSYTDILSDLSDIVIETSGSKAYLNKTFNSVRVGASSNLGTLTLELNKNIDAIGFYAKAWAGDNVTQLKANDTIINVELPDTNSSDPAARVYIELPKATSTVTIGNVTASKNRFHIYSIGFYSKSNFPDVVKYTVAFDANGGTGTMQPVQVQAGESYILPGCTFIPPEGKVFDYWSIGNTQQSESIIVNNDITLKANWKNKPASQTTTIERKDSSPLSTTAENIDSNITIKVSSANTYSAPIRVYANTTVTINALNNHKIVSVTYKASSTGNYVTYASEATVSPSVTPVVDGKNVTWTFNTDTTEFTFKPSAQTRTNGFIIIYQ